MKIKACLTSKKQDWKTPNNIYKFYIEGGYLDPCPENPKFDGLKINWFDKNFVNPPYKEIDKWIDKALREREKGKEILFLIPARTDTKWFRKLYEANCQIRLIQGRLHFNESKSAPFPSMFVRMDKSIKFTSIELITKEEMEAIYSENR